MNITKSMIVLMVIFFQQAIHAQEVALECSTFFRISENEIDFKIGNLSSHNLIYDKKTKRLTHYQTTFLRSALS